MIKLKQVRFAFLIFILLIRGNQKLFVMKKLVLSLSVAILLGSLSTLKAQEDPSKKAHAKEAHKDEHKGEHKDDKKAEHKDAHKADHKDEHKGDHKAEHKDEKKPH